ncbi:MAG TPA: hypothetical protein VLV76_11860 [Candidatus Acidoferrum sp.]|nr:hypothetical protein [Candidatus Acidoferrum sp.]
MRSPEFLGQIPTRDTSAELNIGDKDVYPLSILQVRKRLFSTARFADLIAGSYQLLGEVHTRQRFVLHDEDGDYRTI